MKGIVAGLVLTLAIASNASAGPLGHIIKAPFKAVGMQLREWEQ
jgi:hypothetical protein